MKTFLYAAALISMVGPTALMADGTPVPAKGVPMAWTLNSVDGEQVTYKVTLDNSTDGRIAGRAPCNTYFGRFDVADGKVTVGPIASTRMACAEMASETAYLQMLQAVDQIEQSPGQLVLSGAGHTLSFIQPIE
jgi:heat shock protein HslJ